MNLLKRTLLRAYFNLREYTNYVLGPLRRCRLKNNQFTIISNNCWGGHVYRYFRLPYMSPTIGLYIFPDDYLRFVANLKHYIDSPLTFIEWTSSVHKDVIKERKQTNCPIGKIDDVEIVFLHYHDKEEALSKWNRRKAKIVWNNIIVKFSEQNGCTLTHLAIFDKLDYSQKFVFVSKDYGLSSQVLFSDNDNYVGEVPDDTTLFRKNVNLVKLVNGSHSYRINQKK